MAPLTESSWLEFILALRHAQVNTEVVKQNGLNQLYQFSNSLKFMFHHSVPCVYLLDYTTGKYIFFSENSSNVIGFNRDYFIEGGLEFVIQRYHPDDFRLYNEHIFPERMSFLKKIPPEDHKQYMFSYNFRFKDPKDRFRCVLQRNCFIQSDSQGRPILSMGMAFNVDHFKNPNTSVQLIEKMDPDNPGKEAELVFKKTYHTYTQENPLTKRELELLKLLADGLSSKQIAHNLFLSEHTVIVHRKNMMAKTQTANVAELISWGLRNELI